MSKHCSQCKLIKHESDFNKDSLCLSGLRSYCRQCQANLKRIYLQKKGETMNSAKYESKRKGLNSALTKVFDATPIAEAWSGTAIALEMRRCGTGSVDSRATLGCLNTLVEYGLVEEIGRGQFRRVEIRERLTVSDLQIPLTETVIQEPEMQIKPLSTQTVCSSPIDKLSKLASRLRDLANDMETAALELAEQAERNESETAKMRQLQTLLKSLG